MKHILAIALALCFSSAAQATTYTATNTNDSGPGSLRAALASAANGDTINFSVTGTITLTSAELVVGTNVKIDGPGAAKLAISGNGQFTVFQVNSGVTAATISGLTIEYGLASPNGGGIFNQGNLTVNNSTLLNNGANGDGGDIYNAGTLKVSNCLLSSTPNGSSGAIFNSGRLTVSHSTVSGSLFTPGASGGAIYNARGGKVTVDYSTVGGGVITGGLGGGIYNDGTATVSNSTLSGSVNYSGAGGAVFNGGTMTVSGSTVSGNSATVGGSGGGIFNSVTGTLMVIDSALLDNVAQDDFGGGIYNLGKMTVNNSTLSGNSTNTAGGAIFNDGTLTVSFSTLSGNSAAQGKGGAINNIGTLSLKGTALAGQISGGNCDGGGTSDGYNLSDDGTCTFLTQTGDQNNVTTAGLSTSGLQNNGGPTQTIALLASSSAVDAIPASACTDASGNPATSDQRGVARPQGSGCDIGAFEFVPFVSPTDVNFGNVKRGRAGSANVTLTNSGATTLQIGTISFVDVSGNPADFSFHSHCGAQLSVGQSCTIGVRFSPSQAATETALLNIATNDPGSALQVPVTGTGIQ